MFIALSGQWAIPGSPRHSGLYSVFVLTDVLQAKKSEMMERVRGMFGAKFNQIGTGTADIQTHKQISMQTNMSTQLQRHRQKNRQSDSQVGRKKGIQTPPGSQMTGKQTAGETEDEQKDG
jgi:hypothetical protein